MKQLAAQNDHGKAIKLNELYKLCATNRTDDS